MPPERKEPKAPQPLAPLRVIGPSDVQQQRQIWAPVQLLYAISAGLPAHVAGGGIQSVTATTTAVGPGLTFLGSVTNVGNTFTFTGGGHGATTLAAPFTIPAVGATGAMSVTDGTALAQGTAILIPNGTTVDQQAYEAQVVSGGGTNSLTVITTSVGTYSAGGTIASGTTVTWGQTPTTTGFQPTIAQQTSAVDANPMVMTFGSVPQTGDWLYAVIGNDVSHPVATPAGWSLLQSASTTTGLFDVTMYVYAHQVVGGDGASYTWTASGGNIRSGYLIDVPNVAGALAQSSVTINDTINTTPPIAPFLPDSLTLGLYCIRNGSIGGVPTGWSHIAGVFNSGAIGDLGILQGPPTTTNAIESTCTPSDFAVAVLLIIPPSLGAGGTTGVAGITQINAQGGPFISVTGSPYIGISTTSNQIQVINSGLTTVTGPSTTVTGPFSILGPAVLQIGGNEFFISVAGSGGGGGGSGPTATLHFQQQQIGSLIHQWRCNDAAGSSTLADSKGSTALTVQSAAICGVPGLMNDGASCAYTNGAASSYLSATGVVPTSGAWCIEMLVNALQVWNGSTTGIVCAQGGSGDGSGLLVANNMQVNIALLLGNFLANEVTKLFTGFSPFLLHLEYDGSANAFMTLNGAATISGAITPAGGISGKLYVGTLEASADFGNLFVQNIAIYSARLTTAQKYANMNAVYRR